ncbi:MAG: ribonuclease Y [Planctomycetota bacterium]
MDAQVLATVSGGGAAGGWIAPAIAAALFAGGLGVVAGVQMYRYATKRTITRAREEAEDIRRTGVIESKAAAQQAELDLERSLRETRERFDRESESSRNELRETERRLSKREDKLHRQEDDIAAKLERFEQRAAELDARDAETVARQAELAEQIEEQKQQLLRLSGLSQEEAERRVLERVEEECREEVAHLTRGLVEKAEADAEERSREILLTAMQRVTTETVSEATVRSIQIPSDDMKGRIIGREGRNIRAIEAATGADIIVDDTPGVIVVSCFDTVRRAIAVESLERLIKDGRLHPGRIEETVEKVRGEVEQKIIKHGQDAVLECKLRNVNPKVSEAMGRLAYRTSYGQNVLRHSVEVAHFSQIIAEQLGLNGRLARRAGFLHDIGKAMDHENEGGHPKIGMDFARQHGEKEPVLNVIGGHHGDIPSTSFYTPIVMAADAVSSARPGARRESMERYVQRLNELQDLALSHDGVTEAHAIQAGREVRVMVDAKHVSDDRAHAIACDIAKKVSDEMTFPGEVKVTVLRETRAVEIAR